MSILSLKPKELIAQRKINSDLKDNTSELTHRTEREYGTRAAAYRSKRDLLDEMEIKKLLASSDEDDLLADLELMEKLNAE